MAQMRLSMRHIKEILRLKHDSKLSNRQIARCLGLSKTTVGNYLADAKAAGLNWPLDPDLSETQLHEKLASDKKEASDLKSLPDFNAIHLELKKKSVTLSLLWEEYLQANPKGYRYSQFCHHYRAWAKTLEPSMRQVHIPGQKGFIDYSGETIPIHNPKTGEVKQAQIFVFVLGASNYTYAEASWSQNLESWINSHVGAFEFFGGVPKILVPDNLKSGVTKAHRYEPKINRSYEDMASHYGTAVIPARVRKPKDKAKAESGVLLVQRWILAALRNQTFYSLAEANQAIHDLLEKLNNKPMQKIKKSRRELFIELEKTKLKALPSYPYHFAQFKLAKLNIDYHIQLDQHYYSAPYQLIGKALEVRFTQNLVEIFHDGKRVACHKRSYQAYVHSTLSEHMPKSHREYAQWTPSRMLHWGKSKGKAVGELFEKIMNSRVHPEQGFRACQGIMRLEKDVGQNRLNRACQRALHLGAYSYRHVQRTLKNNLEAMPLPYQEAQKTSSYHENLRGKDYYQLH